MPKTASYRVSEYYDGGVVRLEHVKVPSKRVRYASKNGILVAKVPPAVTGFEAAIRDAFLDAMPKWPLPGRLLVGISISLPKRKYETTDVDNMAKAILDAFKGVAYEDDAQIDSLFTSKSVASKWSTWIAFRSLGTEPQSWFLEPMLIKVPDAAYLAPQAERQRRATRPGPDVLPSSPA